MIDDREPETSRDELISELVEQFLDRLQAGESVNVESFVNDHAEFEDELRRCLPAVEAVARLTNDPVHDIAQSIPSRNANEDGYTSGVLGDFRIHREIGRGGMGLVYEAEQISLGRPVALKVLPLAATLDERQLQRFKNEARAAAMLNHPNIVPIYSVGTERGVHYYAMQLIAGRTLAEVLAEIQQLLRISETEQISNEVFSRSVMSSSQFRPQIEPTIASAPVSDTTVRQSLVPDTEISSQIGITSNTSNRMGDYARSVARIGLQAADALHHAHLQGVLHRDIKPANLMLDAVGKLWITDFGLARLESDAGVTMTGDLVGTIRYMSPEQALAKRVIVDQRTDIYSLGVTLYELLARRPAFDGKDREEVLRQIAFDTPKALCKIESSIPIDLETIVHKAIAKDPESRYQSADELADDLRSFSERKPIKARPIGSLERLLRWSKNNPLISLLSTTVAVLAFLVSVVSAIGYIETTKAYQNAKRERDDAKRAADDANRAKRMETKAKEQAEIERENAVRMAYISDMQSAFQYWQSGQLLHLRRLLRSQTPDVDQDDPRGWEWYFLVSQAKNGHSLPNGGYSVPSPFDSRVATPTSDALRIFDTKQREYTQTLTWKGGCFFNGVAWSPSRDKIACAGHSQFRVWDISTRETLLHSDYQEDRIVKCAWSSDGESLVTVSEFGTFQIVKNQEPILTRQHNYTEGNDIGRFFGDASRQLAWHSESSVIAATGNLTLQFLDSRNLELLFSTREGFGSINDIAFSRDGRFLAVGYHNGRLHIWNIADRHLERKIDVPDGICSLAWHPSKYQLVVGALGQTVSIVDVNLQKPIVQTSYGHFGTVHSVAWAPDAASVTSSSNDGTIRIWPRSDRRTDDLIAAPCSDFLCWSPDGGSLASAGRSNREITIWDVVTRKEQCTLDHGSHIQAMEWTSSGLLFSAGGDAVKIWNPPSQQVARELRHKTGNVIGMSITANGLAVTGTDGGWLHVWNHERGELLAEKRTAEGDNLRALSVSADGVRIVAQVSKGLLFHFESKNLNLIRSQRRIHGIAKLAWDSAGRLAWCGGSNQITIQKDDASSRLSGHGSAIGSLSWNRDGTRLATGGHDHTVRIWDPEHQKELLVLRGHQTRLRAVAWSPDNRQLASGDDNGQILLWSANAGYVNPTLEDTALPPPRVDNEELALAEFYARIRDYDAAVNTLSGIIEKVPPNENAYRQRASIYFEQMKYTQAIEDLSNAIDIRETSYAFRRRGMCYVELGDFSQALTDYRRALAFANTNGKMLTYQRIAFAYARQKKYDEALKAFEKASTFASSAQGLTFVQYSRRGKVLAEMGELKRAKTDLEHAVKVAANPYTQMHLAWFLIDSQDMRFRDLDRGIALAQEAVNSPGQEAISGVYHEAWHALGVGYLRRNQLAKAEEAFAHARSIKASPGVEFHSAIARWRTGDKNGAREKYQRGAQLLRHIRVPNIETLRHQREAASTLAVEE